MKYNLELTEEQVNVVLQSLAKQPLESVLSTFTEIKNQCENQLKTEEND